jgi:hypothetical protein
MLDSYYLTVPVGSDANGNPVLIDLSERAFVVGMVGAGVGNTIRVLIRGVADKPFVELLGIDPYLDLAPWRSRFSSIANNDADTLALLVDLQARFDARTAALSRTMSKRVSFESAPPTDEMPFILVVLPELGVLPREAQLIARRLIARGRYAGIFFILGGLQAITENKLIRDLVGNRIAHALPHKAMTEAVFGALHEEVEPHLLDRIRDRGVGYVQSVGAASRFTAPRMTRADAQAFATMTAPLVPKSLI